ncbi:MAG: ATP-binding protein [Nitrospirota bacterium]
MEQIGNVLKFPEERTITQSTELNRDAGPTCKICDDFSWVVRNGKNMGRCKCQIAKIEEHKYKKLLKESALDTLVDMTFENYRPQNEVQKKALEALSWQHRGYFLFGPVGTGKTHLMAASGLRAIAQNVQTSLVSVPKMLTLMRQSGREGASTDIEKLAIEISYLCLDDLGKEKSTDWTMERLFILIDERYMRHRAGHGHTSVTSNYTLDTLKNRMDVAIIDRIEGMCMPVFLDGESFRRHKL